MQITNLIKVLGDFRSRTYQFPQFTPPQNGNRRWLKFEEDTKVILYIRKWAL